MKKLYEGYYYTVKEGRFQGITGIAVETVEGVGGEIHCLESVDFPNGVISFWGAFDKLRKATAKEELAYRRQLDGEVS